MRQQKGAYDRCMEGAEGMFFFVVFVGEQHAGSEGILKHISVANFMLMYTRIC